MPGGPVHLDGTIQPGDVLLSVDGVAVFGKSPSDLVPHITGPEGTIVSLLILRSEVHQLMVSLRRAPVPRNQQQLQQQLQQPAHTPAHTAGGGYPPGGGNSLGMQPYGHGYVPSSMPGSAWAGGAPGCQIAKWN